MDLNNLAKQLSKYKLSMVDVPSPLADLVRPLDQDTKDFLFQLVWLEKNEPAQEVFDWKLENDPNMDRLFEIMLETIERQVKYDHDSDSTFWALHKVLKSLPEANLDELTNRLTNYVYTRHYHQKYVSKEK